MQTPEVKGSFAQTPHHPQIPVASSRLSPVLLTDQQQIGDAQGSTLSYIFFVEWLIKLRAKLTSIIGLLYIIIKDMTKNTDE